MYVLEPLLIIVVIDWVMKNIQLDHLGFDTKPRRSRRYPAERLGNLKFADNISMMDNDQEGAHDQINRFSSTAKENKLIINSKTKFLTTNTTGESKLQLDG